jgi:serine/threonine-protein phosphatase 2A regulatory subunit B''
MFSGALFDRLDVGRSGRVALPQFLRFWESRLAGGDTAARAFETLRQEGASYVTHADMKPLMLDLLASHPGLDFLREAPEFQERYCETVVYRLFYAIAKADPHRMTLRELRRSDALEAMFALDETDDINRVLRYFSYEHFYVIYCRFWELDSDHDFLLDREDLLRYGGHALTYRIVDRVFAGAGRAFTSGVAGRMGYEDFVWFILSEEDKSSAAALAYWFRCLDLDGDGVIRPAEAAHFYEEQLQRMECLAQEPVAFEDVLCQMADMLCPEAQGRITLADLRACKLAGQFFNVLFNLGKFVAHEARDPFTIRAERDDPSLTEWDRFARAEYLRLSLEEEAEGGGVGVGAGEEEAPLAWEQES